MKRRVQETPRKNGKRAKRIAISLTPEIYNLVKQDADRLGLSLSRQVFDILNAHYKQEQKEKARQ